MLDPHCSLQMLRLKGKTRLHPSAIYQMVDFLDTLVLRVGILEVKEASRQTMFNDVRGLFFKWVAHTHGHTHAYTYTCMHTHGHTHTYTYTCMHTHGHTHTYTYTCMHTHGHTHTYTYTCMHTHGHTHTYTYTCMHTHGHTHTYTYTCMHTHGHTHTHTHINIVANHVSTPTSDCGMDSRVTTGFCLRRSSPSSCGPSGSLHLVSPWTTWTALFARHWRSSGPRWMKSPSRALTGRSGSTQVRLCCKLFLLCLVLQLQLYPIATSVSMDRSSELLYHLQYPVLLLSRLQRI